jgi:hypothetical protein
MNECNSSSRSAQRKKQQQQPRLSSTVTSTPIESSKISDSEEQNNVTEDLATMDLSAFCMAVQRDNDIQQTTTVVEEKPIINGYDFFL